MKKIFFSIIAICIGMCAVAQVYFYVCKTDGTKVEYKVSEVDSISFMEYNITPTIEPLSGVFSVSTNKTVKFAPGNLQCALSATDTVWAFAENQYDMLGKSNVSGSVLADKIDLFGWSSNNIKAPWGISTSKTNGYYSGEFVDWGKNIGDGNTWRTLTKEEWVYLFRTRNDAVNKYGAACIRLNNTDSVTGIIVLPDSWNCPSGVEFKSGMGSWYTPSDYAKKQVFELSQWQQLEAAGALFLPAAGYRPGFDVNNLHQNGSYWSSVVDDENSNNAYGFGFDGCDIATEDSHQRSWGQSVRLVQDANSKSEGTITTSYNISVAENTNGIVTLSATTAKAGETVTLTITPNSGYELQMLSVTCNGKEVSVTNNSFVMPEGEVEISAVFVASSTENSHAWVDLGLPSGLRWATTNVGATNPEDYGDYYAWGEITTKDSYTWENYTLANGSEDAFTKYCSNSHYGKDGFTDELTTLEAADDAATQIWGENWRMPTMGEWAELINNCTWTWTTKNGVNGYEVKATNGNSIFLPAAGSLRGGELYDAGSSGGYWSSSLLTYNPQCAEEVYFRSSYPGSGGGPRYFGQPVRPVMDTNSKSEGTITISYSISVAENTNGIVTLSTTTAKSGETVTLTITPNSGYELQTLSVTSGGKEVTVTNNSFVMPEGEVEILAIFEAIEYKITIAETANGTVTPSATTASAGETVTLTITPNSGYELQTLSVTCNGKEVSVTNNSFVMPAGNVEISASFVASSTENSHTWVDLGLPSGLLWATCNVGATNPEDCGDYYAWGEIATKSTYDWSTYKYANGSSVTFTKYCTSSSYGTVDNKTILEAADDVATQNWGGNWRMPTSNEWKELIDNCDWTWITKNSVNGYEVKATNGNSIFLPAAGSGLLSAGSGGFYWSSSLYTYTCGAQEVYFNSDSHELAYYGNRSYGQSVRPVQDANSKSEETITTSYNISVAENTNGIVTLSATTAKAGETVTLTIIPNSGYELQTLSVTCNGKEVSVTNNSFVMPEGEVEISASFASSPITVSFYKPSTWKRVYLYSWTAGVNKATEQMGAWPGTELTKVNADGFYYHTFDASLKEINFIFHAGTGLQTSDLWTDEDVCYAWSNGAEKKLEDCKTTFNITVSETTNGTITPSTTTAQIGETITLKVTPDSHYYLQSLNVMCGNEKVAVTDRSFVMPAGDVTISATFVFVSGTENGYDYVDLGLPSGLKWATCNLDATKPEDYGNYYAWGEIATQDSSYTWSTYKYANGSSITLTKYNNSSSNGIVDNKTTLEAADDAATQNWGGNWRMPTIGEWQELIDNCAWTWTTLNGVNGYEVKATNGNSIFLPAAGSRNDGGLHDAGTNGRYWSSSLYTDDPNYAQYVFFYSDYHGTVGRSRACGRSVRPVLSK